MHFGFLLRRIRKTRGLNVRKLASLARVNEQTITRYESKSDFTGQTDKLDQILAALAGFKPLTGEEVTDLANAADTPLVAELVAADGARPQSLTDPTAPAVYRLADALIALVGVRNAAVMLSELVAGTANAQQDAAQQSNAPNDTGDNADGAPPDLPSGLPPGLIAVHQPPVETEDGTYHVRVVQSAKGTRFAPKDRSAHQQGRQPGRDQSTGNR